MKIEKIIASTTTVCLLLVSCGGGRQANAERTTATTGDMPPVEVSIHRTYPVPECMEWFGAAIKHLQESGMDDLKITSAVPTLFTCVTTGQRDSIEAELCNLELPDSVHYAWLSSHWAKEPNSPRWDMIVYQWPSLLCDTITDMTEDRSISDYPQVTWRFHNPSTFARVTRDNIGRAIALAINGHVVMAPTVNCEIESGNCAVGAMTLDSLRTLLPR